MKIIGSKLIPTHIWYMETGQHHVWSWIDVDREREGEGRKENFVYSWTETIHMCNSLTGFRDLMISHKFTSVSWMYMQLERLSPSGSLSSTRLRLVHPLTPCPSYTISLLHHLPLIHRHTSHARCVKACLNRRNAIAYVLHTVWWRTKERNI